MPVSHAGHRGSQKVRLHSHIPEQSPSPTFLLLTIFRGLAGVTFLCFGELFWMHLSRIGLEHEGKLLGSIALILGAAMAVAALCGAAGLSFSQDDGGRLPLLGAVLLSAPLSLADFVAALTFVVKRSMVLRLDREHEESRGQRPRPGPPIPGQDSQDGADARADYFQRLYDVFIFLALAISLLEAIMFRLGRKRAAAAAAQRRQTGPRSLLFSGALEALLEEDNVGRNGSVGWPARNVNQSALLEQRCEQLRRTSLERNVDLLEQARGGNRNSL